MSKPTTVFVIIVRDIKIILHKTIKFLILNYKIFLTIDIYILKYLIIFNSHNVNNNYSLKILKYPITKNNKYYYH